MKALLKLVFLSMLIGGLVSCGGSGSRNDEGVSMSFMGFYQFPNGLTANASGVIGDVGRSMSVRQLTTIDQAFEQLTYLGIQNNLNGQFIRLQNVHVKYEIPGYNLFPPSASYPKRGVLVPSANDPEQGETNLPDILVGQETDGIKTTVFAAAPLFPPPVADWFAANKAALPNKQFNLIITYQVEGITSAGDTLFTTEEGYIVFVTPQGNGQIGGGGGSTTTSPTTTTTTVTATTTTSTTTTTGA
jgi:hypothetical protein